MRLPDKSSIFTAELKAIDLALSNISNNTNTNFVIFSDSLSVLLALKNQNTDNNLVKNIKLKLHDILKHKSVGFCWIPSHIGIRGNEYADRLAKESLMLPNVNIKIPHGDFNHPINNLIKANWQAQWNNAAFNKLRDIKPYIEPSTQFSQVNRRNQVVLTRCRICLLYTSPSPRDGLLSRMPSSA